MYIGMRSSEPLVQRPPPPPARKISQDNKKSLEISYKITKTLKGREIKKCNNMYIGMRNSEPLVHHQLGKTTKIKESFLGISTMMEETLRGRKIANATCTRKNV